MYLGNYLKTESPCGGPDAGKEGESGPASGAGAEESTRDKIMRELQLLCSGMASIPEVMVESVTERPIQTAAKVAASVAIGAVLSEYGGACGAKGLIAQNLGTALSLSFLGDVAFNSGRVWNAGVDTWSSPNNWETNKQVMKETVGQFGADTLMLGAGISTSRYLLPKSRLWLPTASSAHAPLLENSALESNSRISDTKRVLEIMLKERPPESTLPGHRLTPEQLERLELARPESGKDKDWIRIYEESFPEHDRQPLEEIFPNLEDGSMVLNVTKDRASGKAVTFTLFEHYEGSPDKEPFLLNAFIATDPAWRSTGVGSLHLDTVAKTMRHQFPQYKFLVAEIESPVGLPASAHEVRRWEFYKKLGWKMADCDYELPLYQPPEASSYIPQSQLGNHRTAAKVIYFPLQQEKTMDGKSLKGIIGRLLNEGYSVEANDPYLNQRLSLIDTNTSY